MAQLEAVLEPLHLPSGVIDRLARYGRLVLEANRRVNLTGARSEEEIAEQIADSLSVLPFVGGPYVDVGAGAGFPAIPIAIVTGLEPTAIEATAKKARLLESFLEALGLGGTIVNARAELAGRRPDLRERFASGTARAVGSASAVVELLLPFIAIGGSAVLQRGTMEAGERSALEDAALMLGGVLEAEHVLGGKRRVLIVRKDQTTPERFPRRAGLPQKRPLCE
jgi:16S rRNA (guanine527-N7)-methyltransferase